MCIFQSEQVIKVRFSHKNLVKINNNPVFFSS